MQFLVFALFALASLTASGEIFRFPTANHALLEENGGERFFVGTTGRPWTSGMFGCVRSEGYQMHEGLDIKCLRRDAHSEPIDPVMASASGTVAYLNLNPALSNYGKYVVLKHHIEGLEIYTVYAHLREIKCAIGQSVDAGDVIAIMGRTANTRESITKERAHVHFEIDLFINERFPTWYAKTFPGQRNDHGQWNGQNLVGLDPRLILLAQAQEGSKFSLIHYIRSQTELCRVIVRDTHFPWLKRYTGLIKRNALADREGVAGYEIALNYNGVPVELIPRAASEIHGSAKYQVLSVNATEQQQHPCRKLVIKRGDKWDLAAAGRKLLDLLTY